MTLEILSVPQTVHMFLLYMANKDVMPVAEYNRTSAQITLLHFLIQYWHVWNAFNIA